jgi:LysM repeat protein
MSEQSSNNFSGYSLMQFDPSAPAGGQAEQPVVAQTTSAATGIGGPVGSETEIAMAKGEGATSAVLAAHAAEVEASPPALYVVQPGDTVISIAVANDLEWGPLLALNGMDENSILQPGQTIQLR